MSGGAGVHGPGVGAVGGGDGIGGAGTKGGPGAGGEGGPGVGAVAGPGAVGIGGAGAKGEPGVGAVAGPGAVGGGDGIGGAEGRRSALSSGPWQPPDAAERYEILAAARTVALVGASPNPSRSSFFVATYLLSSTPYEVFFVNPRASEILGRPVYPALADLPVKPDIVDVFRRHDDLPGVAREAVAADARVLWLQLGSWHEEAAELATRAGLKVVMDRCLKIEHARFHGGLHLAGFDTGVISSRRALVAGPARPTEPGRGSR